MQHPFMTSTRIPKQLPPSVLTQQLPRTIADQFGSQTQISSCKLNPSTKTIESCKESEVGDRAKSEKGISERLLRTTSFIQYELRQDLIVIFSTINSIQIRKIISLKAILNFLATIFLSLIVQNIKGQPSTAILLYTSKSGLTIHRNMALVICCLMDLQEYTSMMPPKWCLMIKDKE